MNNRKDAIPTARVLKLGGSLLLISDWPRRLHNWLSQYPAPLNLLLVGGGEIVESVRRLDAQHHFSPSFSHWLCVDLLSATTRIANQLLPEFPLVATSDELWQIVRQQPRSESTMVETSCPNPESLVGATYLVDVSTFYKRPASQLTATAPVQLAMTSITNATSSTPVPLDSKAGEKRLDDCLLPESWSTTSDSLAAWLARVVGAQTLILFKSMTPAKQFTTPQSWVEQGIVDAAFADTLPDGMSVQIVNLLGEVV